MEIFTSTLNQMLLMFLLIFVGILLRKSKILPEDSGTTLSKLELYALTPALNFHNWAQNCTLDTLTQNTKLILYGAIMVGIAIALAYPLSKLFVRNSSQSAELDYQRNIYKYAMTFGNYGYVGNYIILSVFGSAMFFRYSMFNFIVGFVCSSWGLYILAPKRENGKQSVNDVLKRFFTPPVIAMLLGALVGLTNTKQFIPDFIMNAASNAGDCMGPIAMILAGFVVGAYDFKEMLGKKKVYVAALLRLIVIPAVFMLVLHLVGIEKDIMTLALITFATPLGMNTIVYPAAYGQDTQTGASMTMISTAFSVITIPLMYLVFIVLL